MIRILGVFLARRTDLRQSCARGTFWLNMGWSVQSDNRSSTAVVPVLLYPYELRKVFIRLGLTVPYDIYTYTYLVGNKFARQHDAGRNRTKNVIGTNLRLAYRKRCSPHHVLPRMTHTCRTCFSTLTPIGFFFYIHGAGRGSILLREREKRCSHHHTLPPCIHVFLCNRLHTYHVLSIHVSVWRRRRRIDLEKREREARLRQKKEERENWWRWNAFLRPNPEYSIDVPECFEI